MGISIAGGIVGEQQEYQGMDIFPKNDASYHHESHFQQTVLQYPGEYKEFITTCILIVLC